MQETERQPKLSEAEFGPVAPRLGNNAVQHAGKVQGLGKVQILVQRDRLAAANRLMQGVIPNEDLVGADVLDVERQRDRGVGQVDGLHGRAKMQQPISPGDFKQPLLECAQHDVLLAAVVLLKEPWHAGQIELEVDVLVAIILQVV